MSETSEVDAGKRGKLSRVVFGGIALAVLILAVVSVITGGHPAIALGIMLLGIIAVGISFRRKGRDD